MSLDLIALDSCPFPFVNLPVGSPFMFRIVHRHDQGWAVVAAWADAAAVVAIRMADMRPGRWLSISSDEQRLLLELCDVSS